MDQATSLTKQKIAVTAFCILLIDMLQELCNTAYLPLLFHQAYFSLPETSSIQSDLLMFSACQWPISDYQVLTCIIHSSLTCGMVQLLS